MSDAVHDYKTEVLDWRRFVTLVRLGEFDAGADGGDEDHAGEQEDLRLRADARA